MFSKNLKHYRLKKQMTKKDLAAACGISSMAISNYESGKRKPDMEIISKLAQALGIYVVDFLASRNDRLSFVHNEFRKHSALSKSKQEYIKDSIEEYFSRFFDAVECLGGDPLPEPLQCRSHIITGDHEKDAVILRRCIGLQEDGPIDELVAVLEDKGVLVLELDVGSDRFFGINGFVDRYPYIVINKNMKPERKRTTILHELAHLIFDWDGVSEDARERWATAIAGAALISRRDIIRELGMRRSAITKDMTLVCQEYGISMYLLVKRAALADIISDHLERDFYIKANKADWKNAEPRRVRNIEEPLLFKQLVYRAINEEGVSVQRGAELLRVSTSEIEQYCGLMEV